MMKTRPLFLLTLLLFAGFLAQGCGSGGGGSRYSRAVEFKIGLNTSPRETIEIEGHKYVAGHIILLMKPAASRDVIKQNVALLVNRYNLDPTVYTLEEIGYEEKGKRFFSLSYQDERPLFSIIYLLEREPLVERAYPNAIAYGGGS